MYCSRSDTAIFVFSYNRSSSLNNCLNSIRSLVPGIQGYIIDDNSDDQETINVIDKASSDFSALSPDKNSVSEFKTGGLYGNMNFAIGMASEMGFKRALFIQDDMQLVRPLVEQDWREFDRYFAKVPETIQLATVFIRSLDSWRYPSQIDLCKEARAYFCKPEHEGGKSNFAATGIFDVDRVLDRFGRFEAGEARNSEKARSMGLRMGRAVNPFMNWTPYPASFRGKKRSLKHRLVEFVGGSGFHPIEYMDETTLEHFLSRDPEIFPVMEEWLRSPTAPRQDRWSTGGGEYNLIARFGWLEKLVALKRNAISSPQNTTPKSDNASAR